MVRENINELAIVIPAYKIDFFEETLKSLSNQTCKDFTVYVGDDCSPSDFGSLIEEYKDRLDIRYTKFKTNLGSKDLVAQWTRCIELTEGEPWLWLFSDDDVMGERCVESFYKVVKSNYIYDLYHFDIDAIDDSGKVIFECRRFPDVLSSLDFYKKKEKDDIDCFVVEYIFSRNVYEETGGFQNFELAWGADIATWVKFSHNKGIKNIPGAHVYWRKSNINITPNREPDIVMRKFLINVEYFAWINNFFGPDMIAKFNEYAFTRNFVFYSRILTRKQLSEVSDKAIELRVTTESKKLMLQFLLPLIRVAKLIKSKIKPKKIQ